jgi:hypothetical protein
MRKIFRKIFVTAALIAGSAAAGALMPSQASAMTISTPAAVQEAIGGGAIEQVRYVCRRVRHCNWRGCYWRRACYHRPSYRYYGHRYYRHHRYHRHHRRHWY